jgi:anti-anti-sigma regulatory factor
MTNPSEFGKVSGSQNDQESTESDSNQEVPVPLTQNFLQSEQAMKSILEPLLKDKPSKVVFDLSVVDAPFKSLDLHVLTEALKFLKKKKIKYGFVNIKDDVRKQTDNLYIEAEVDSVKDN